MFERLTRWARALKRDVVALWLAARDARTPWSARIVAGVVAAYALSPIDLIPDVVPVIGYVDDLLIVPAGIWLALRLVPPPLIAEFRAAAEARATKPVSRIAAAMIALVWIVAAATVIRWVVWR